MNETTDNAASKTKKPLTFLVSKWIGYILATMFLLYGGANLIFGALDRNFNDFLDFGIMLFYGTVLIILAYAFRDLKLWGWYGLIAVNAIAAIYLILSFTNYIDGILLAIFIVGIGSLLWPSTKQEILGQ